MIGLRLAQPSLPVLHHVDSRSIGGYVYRSTPIPWLLGRARLQLMLRYRYLSEYTLQRFVVPERRWYMGILPLRRPLSYQHDVVSMCLSVSTQSECIFSWTVVRGGSECTYVVLYRAGCNHERATLPYT